jgi:hypothetical protein
MITDFLKQLRNMPYTDMVLIASELGKHIQVKGSTRDIADGLAALAATPLPDRSDISKAEQEALRKVFGRDRTIKVRKLNNNGKHGWHVEVTGPHGASVVNTDLKTALDQLLDTVAAAAALKG